MKTKRILSFLLLLAMLITAFASCGGQSETESNSSANTESTAISDVGTENTDATVGTSETEEQIGETEKENSSTTKYAVPQHLKLKQSTRLKEESFRVSLQLSERILQRQRTLKKSHQNLFAFSKMSMHLK